MFDDSDGFDLNFHFLHLKDLEGIMSGSPKGGKKNEQLHCTGLEVHISPAYEIILHHVRHVRLISSFKIST